MARSRRIHLVYVVDPTADWGCRLFGAFTVKHEMKTAIAGLAEREYYVQSVPDGLTLSPFSQE